MKKLIKSCIVGVLALGFALTPVHIELSAALPAIPWSHFETRERTRLSRDTYLHQVTRITAAGLVDINVLEIPLNDPYLDIGVFNSQVELGLRQSTTALLNAQNALAGVNGDFFGMSSRHSVPLGLEMVGGEMSVQGGANSGANDSASLLLGDGAAFMDYVRPQVLLLLNGQRTFYVGLVNMVANMTYPSILTHGYITSTDSIDARVGRSYKVVVEDGIITVITFFTVDVPENGFVIIMSPQTFEANSHYFYLGQRAEMSITANVNLDAVHTAISGNHRILHNGAVPDTAAMRSNARHPRTLMGLNWAGDRLILMTIDGRNHSIGATLAEAAVYMLQFGAAHAVNLDGGGSTTMATRLPGEDLTVVNRPSEGSQRAVINALGVINNAPIGALSHVEVVGDGGNIAVGIPRVLTFNGFDEYMNQIVLTTPPDEIVVINGSVTDAGIVADSAGSVVVQARFGNVVAWGNFTAIDVREIVSNVQTLHDDTQLNFHGIDNYGRRAWISAGSLDFQVYPAGLGRVESGRFVSTGGGNGWLRVATATAYRYIPIGLNRQQVQIDPIEPEFTGYVSFSSYPASVGGFVAFSPHASYGSHSLVMSYNFAQATHSQAAHMNFADSGYANAIAYTIAVYGNNSNHWLRGNIVDRDGNTFVIDFADRIDFYGWRDVTAQVPAEAVFPVRLTRIHAVALSQETAGNHALHFDNLRIYQQNEGAMPNVPISSVARDSLRRDFVTAPSYGEFDVVFGEGVNDFTAYATFCRPDGFGVTEMNDLLVLELNAGDGGIMRSGAYQWTHLSRYLDQITANTIVIHTNLPHQRFTNHAELRLFRQLVEERASLGRNVFVVSVYGESLSVDVVEGVRYVNLPRLYNPESELLNAQFALLRLRFGSHGVHYSVERVFE
ncbi:MAG: phosphodiester glycosidase family protein [Defluviitaleaceae bacterium]|nr:phosphodiester glycosidase family protein [Defluviitaleaceae bacterium]